MNIFFLDQDPRQCAEWMVDKHVVKMIVETAQLLSTAHRIMDGEEVIVHLQHKETGKVRKKNVWVLPDDRNESLYACIQIITLYKKQCFVRVTELNKTLVRMCLDAGATGIIFSTIESYSQGKEIVEFCTYPLFKGKRGCGLVRENQWGEYSLGTNKPLIIGQIETQTAVDNLDSICTCGFDMFIIGPYDLSNSLNSVS